MAERTRSERPVPRRALVMGATGRLGVAIAHALASRCGEVVLTSRDATKLELLASSIESASGRDQRAVSWCARVSLANRSQDGPPVLARVRLVVLQQSLRIVHRGSASRD